MAKGKNPFTYPYDIAFTLPEGATGHVVTVQIVAGDSYQTIGTK